MRSDSSPILTSQDNRLLASTSKDGDIKVWSIENADPEGDNQVEEVEDDEDEEIDDEHEREKRRKEREEEKAKQKEGVGIKLNVLGSATGHLSAVTAVAWPNRSNHFLVSVSEDSTLKVNPCFLPFSLDKLWNTKLVTKNGTISTLGGVKAHEKGINHVAVGKDDSTIATGSLDKTVKIWKRKDEPPYLSLAGTLSGHRRGVWSVAFSPVDKVSLLSRPSLMSLGHRYFSR